MSSIIFSRVPRNSASSTLTKRVLVHREPIHAHLVPGRKIKGRLVDLFRVLWEKPLWCYGEGAGSSPALSVTFFCSTPGPGLAQFPFAKDREHHPVTASSQPVTLLGMHMPLPGNDISILSHLEQVQSVSLRQAQVKVFFSLPLPECPPCSIDHAC